MPSLPLDLERLIFEIAALQDTDHNSRVRLTLVAKRVYEWIQPILLRVIVILREPWKIPGELTNLNWRNAQVINTPQFVRHLLTDTRDESLLLEMISTFPNIEDIAIWGTISPQLKNMKDLPLRMLSASINLDHAIEDCPAFQNLTHLEILNRSSGCPTVLIGLPKLTHLCFDLAVPVKDAVVFDLLKHCASLRVLILIYNTRIGGVARTMMLDDPRYLVLLHRISRTELVEEWKRSANGLIGCWELAEVIVDARKANLFKEKTPFVE